MQSNLLCQWQRERKGWSTRTLLFVSLQLCLHVSITLNIEPSFRNCISFDCNIKLTWAIWYQQHLEHTRTIFMPKKCMIRQLYWNYKILYVGGGPHAKWKNWFTHTLDCYQDWFIYLCISALGYYTKCRCWVMAWDVEWACRVFLDMGTNAFLRTWTH